MNERKYYIDNLRSICILLLFPFHTSMVFNSFGEPFYIQGKPCEPATWMVLITYPWWMTGLFVLAGMSSVYALRHRTGKQYMKERVNKLLIPFISALFLIVPIQTYLADCFHYGYQGGYFMHFKEFFTLTNFSGYDGHLTPAHTWFILYLFVISMICTPLLIWYKKRSEKIDGNRLTMVKILLLGLIPMAGTRILDIGGKSIGQFAFCFLLGYFILSMEEVQERLDKNRIWLGIAWVILMALRLGLYYWWKFNMAGWDAPWFDIVYGIEQEMYCWIGIIAMLGLGRHHLKFHNKITQEFAAGSFPIYLFHQSVLVIMAYLFVGHLPGAGLQFTAIMVTTFVVTVVLYLLCRKWCVTRFLFGIKTGRKLEKK